MTRALAVFLLLFLSACATAPLPDGTVKTSQGLATGLSADGITEFLGIEYARAERWQLPQDGPSWKGVKTFDKHGPACPQDGQKIMIEDCLFLNVFAPEDHTQNTNLPVLVWIHGGGFRAGEGGDAQKVFALRDIVVVTFNYRLGKLGFHNWQGWTDQKPRNFGQADMVKALEWVQTNIAQFGGNPDNITLAGHSAGGMGVQLMMVDPRADGLFHRAFSDAGYGTWPFPQVRYAGKEPLEPLRIDATSEDLVAEVPFFHLPYIGGSDLPRQPVEVFLAGDQTPVPYMAGANSYDGYRILEGAGFTADRFLSRYSQNPAIAKAYAKDFAVSDAQAAIRLFGDMRYAFAAWKTASAMQYIGLPGYLFYYDTPMYGLPGTPHGAHYADIFKDPNLPFTSYLISFIKTGAPVSDGMPQWPAYSDEQPTWMMFTPNPSPTSSVLSEKMSAIETLEFPRAAD